MMPPSRQNYGLIALYAEALVSSADAGVISVNEMHTGLEAMSLSLYPDDYIESRSKELIEALIVRGCFDIGNKVQTISDTSMLTYRAYFLNYETY